MVEAFAQERPFELAIITVVVGLAASSVMEALIFIFFPAQSFLQLLSSTLNQPFSQLLAWLIKFDLIE